MVHLLNLLFYVALETFLMMLSLIVVVRLHRSFVLLADEYKMLMVDKVIPDNVQHALRVV